MKYLCAQISKLVVLAYIGMALNIMLHVLCDVSKFECHGGISRGTISRNSLWDDSVIIYHIRIR
jgi:hypothetical protein